jgi:hypothetical protein
VRTAEAGNGWALLLGARRTRQPPPRSKIRAEAVDAKGRIVATGADRFALP